MNGVGVRGKGSLKASRGIKGHRGRRLAGEACPCRACGPARRRGSAANAAPPLLLSCALVD